MEDECGLLKNTDSGDGGAVGFEIYLGGRTNYVDNW